jgi:integrase
MKGSLTRRGPRSWRLKYDLPRARPGERERRYITLHGTKAQAQAEAAKVLAGLATGAHVDPSGRRWRVRRALAQGLGGQQRLEQDVYQVRAAIAQAPLRPHRSDADQEAARGRPASDLRRDGQGWTLPTAPACICTASSAPCSRSTQWGVVARNVATMVDAPRVSTRNSKSSLPEQLKVVLASLRSPELRTIADVALGTGLRRGELLALRWQDAKLDAAVLRVEQAVEQTKRGGIIMKAPKTRHGRRAVSLAPATVAVLREHWKAQQETRLALGFGKAPANAFVFANGTAPSAPRNGSRRRGAGRWQRRASRSRSTASGIPTPRR